MKNVTLDS